MAHNIFSDNENDKENIFSSIEDHRIIHPQEFQNIVSSLLFVRILFLLILQI